MSSSFHRDLHVLLAGQLETTVQEDNYDESATSTIYSLRKTYQIAPLELTFDGSF